MRLFAVLALFVLAACGGTPGAATPGAATPGTAAPGGATPGGATPGGGGDAAASVDIVDFAFEPATIDVATGQTITWTNTGAAPHTVTFADGPDSGNMAPGATFEHAFDAAGSFEYVCAIHPTMTGTVNVGQ